MNAGSTATKAATQVTSALSSGSPTGVAAALSGKVFSNIKYLNITYSQELREALENWDSNTISLGFSIDLPDSMKSNISNDTLPYMFAYYDVSSDFLENFWQNFIMLLILVFIYTFIRLLLFLALKYQRKYFSPAFFNTLRVMAQNFICTQLYGIYGDLILYSCLEWRGFSFTRGLSGLSFAISSLLLIIMIIGFVFHAYLLIKYQRIKKVSEQSKNDKILEKFEKENEGTKVLFRDFKDETIYQQSFLLFFTGKDLLISIILTTLFDHPLLQSTLLVGLNLAMIYYLLGQKPFRSIMDGGQQLFYEVMAFVVHSSVLIMAIFDEKESSTVFDTRIILGKAIIMINICFNYITLVFILVKLISEGYEAFQAFKVKRALKKKQLLSTKRPEGSFNTSSAVMNEFDITKIDNANRVLSKRQRVRELVERIKIQKTPKIAAKNIPVKATKVADNSIQNDSEASLSSARQGLNFTRENVNSNVTRGDSSSTFDFEGSPQKIPNNKAFFQSSVPLNKGLYSLNRIQQTNNIFANNDLFVKTPGFSFEKRGISPETDSKVSSDISKESKNSNGKQNDPFTLILNNIKAQKSNFVQKPKKDVKKVHPEKNDDDFIKVFEFEKEKFE